MASHSCAWSKVTQKSIGDQYGSAMQASYKLQPKKREIKKKKEKEKKSSEPAQFSADKAPLFHKDDSKSYFNSTIVLVV